MAKASAPSVHPTLSSKLGPAITKAATTLGVAAPSLSGNNGKTYETWALFELAAGLPSSRTVEARGHNGKPLTTPFIVRGGPGYIPPPTSRATEPSYFLISGGPVEFEIHNSLEHRGTSGETHELDVSVVPREWAESVRAHAKATGNRFPYIGPVVAGLEMKAYDAAATIPKSFARALLGAIVDLAPLAVVSLSIGGTELQSSPFPNFKFGLMTTAAMSVPTDAFLRYYRLEPGQEQNHTGQTSLNAFIAGVAALI